jgi:hypothetical protein
MNRQLASVTAESERIIDQARDAGVQIPALTREQIVALLILDSAASWRDLEAALRMGNRDSVLACAAVVERKGWSDRRVARLLKRNARRALWAAFCAPLMRRR